MVDVEDPAHVGVRDLPGQVHLALEQRHEAFILAGRGQDRLERDAPVQLEVLRLVQLAHAALGEVTDHAEAVCDDVARTEHRRAPVHTVEAAAGRVLGASSGQAVVARAHARLLHVLPVVHVVDRGEEAHGRVGCFRISREATIARRPKTCLVLQHFSCRPVVTSRHRRKSLRRIDLTPPLVRSASHSVRCAPPAFGQSLPMAGHEPSTPPAPSVGDAQAVRFTGRGSLGARS